MAGVYSPAFLYANPTGVPVILPTEQISRPHVETDENCSLQKGMIPSPTATALIKDSTRAVRRIDG